MSSPRDGQVFPLAADSKTLDDLLVASLVACFDVIEEPATQAHHLEQAAPRMVVLFMHLEVFGQPVDALRQERDVFPTCRSSGAI